MAFSGGTYTLLYNWTTEQATPPIEISKLQAQDADMATALSNCILRDGTGIPTATTPWNSQRISGLGTATARTDAITTAQVQDFSVNKIGTVAGTDTITGSLTPAITAYVSGMLLTFVPAATNTGAATINVNSVGAKSIVKETTTALAAGDLVINVPAVLLYDGTNMLLLNPQKISSVTATGTVTAATVTASGTVTGATVAATATLTVGGVAAVTTDRTLSVSGTGLSGGGDLSANRTVTIDQTAMTTRNITGKAGVTKTLGTSAASGGSDGDIWYRY